MISTLRITGIIAAILAAVVIVFPAFFGVKADVKSEEYLAAAGAIENFEKIKGSKKLRGAKNQISPLVKQAKAFSLYLNPPKPKPSTKRQSSGKKSGRKGKISVATKPRAVTAKFKLIGTSYYQQKPEMSLALIDEPGKGLRWVWQSSKVGHLLFDQIKDGVVVISDGKKTYEVVVEVRPQRKSLVKGELSGSKVIIEEIDETADEVVSISEASIKLAEPSAEDDEAFMANILEQLKAMQASVDASEGEIAEEAAMEGFITELEAMRVGEKEADELDRLGKTLKRDSETKNRTRGRRFKRTRKPKGSAE